MDKSLVEFQQNLENLVSEERIKSYGSVEKHFENLYLVAKITPKIASIEIALRNILDFYLKQNNQDWILCSDSDMIKKMREDIQSKDKIILKHYQILSRLTLGNVIQIILEYKLQNKIFDLQEFDFALYSSSNRNFGIINEQKVDFSNIDKVNIVLSLLQNIRNRGFHWENLLKVRESKGKYFPRITTKQNKTFIGIEPIHICLFLDDLLKVFNRDMVKLTDFKGLKGI